jgi:hypothetical protein
MHALGERTDFVDLQIFGALMPDLYGVLALPGVHYRSGFFGPAERFLRDTGASIDFVPADFRRFAPILRKLTPRVMATAGSPPVDGWVSLSLHAGASVDEIHRAAADPERLLIVEVSEKYPNDIIYIGGYNAKKYVENGIKTDKDADIMEVAKGVLIKPIFFNENILNHCF